MTYACRAKGIFRKDGLKPLVGDEVDMEVTDSKDLEGSVTSLLKRKNTLIRPAVANVDQALLVFAVREPQPNLLLLDRLLVVMDRQNIPSVICFQKTDLDKEEAARLEKIYQKSGHTVLLVSAFLQDGVEEVRKALSGKVTVIAGPSGVGKSTLTNLFHGEEAMQTGGISRKLGRGRHTTRHCEILPIGRDSFLVDTPGFTSLYLPEMEEEDLRKCYSEFRAYEKECRFLGCRHEKEPSCSVKEAVEKGSIPRERYENYLSLCREIQEAKRY